MRKFITIEYANVSLFHLNRACVKCLVKRGFVYNGLIVTGDMVKLGRKLLKAY